MEQVTNEELARIINKGFDGMQSQFNGMQSQFTAVNERLNNVDDRLDNIDARLGRLENDVKELRGEIVYRHEFEDALARIKLLEKKAGIESGK